MNFKNKKYFNKDVYATINICKFIFNAIFLHLFIFYCDFRLLINSGKFAFLRQAQNFEHSRFQEAHNNLQQTQKCMWAPSIIISRQGSKW